MLEMFNDYQEHYAKDQEIREDIRAIVRDLDQLARGVVANIQSVHQKASPENILTVCEKIMSKFPQICDCLQNLSAKIPHGEYYKYHDHWKFVMQRLVFLCSFVVYLQRDELISRQETAKLLKVELEWEKGFHLDLDDYLIGILNLASELSRMAVNTVIAGDYSRPARIASFISELDAAFRLLNLKNDALRKRFDSLKYDLKKVEEVVYDLSIRGLKPSEPVTSDREEKIDETG